MIKGAIITVSKPFCFWLLQAAGLGDFRLIHAVAFAKEVVEEGEGRPQKAALSAWEQKYVDRRREIC